eukprot:TRINITY_DN224_c0_g1_i1.p1 TRINITY_DN224_c0_g1~~TRINITY_DN224_c0_g1_i1.p1  ORF type:complete len:615 (-),score=106.58 TRINITY_DN224_c0_g1_i1:26-1870(-)
MVDNNSPNPLWLNVNTAIEEDRPNEVLKYLNKISKSEPTNINIPIVKVTCYILLDEISTALKTIESNSIAEFVPFELAYCLYRLNRFEDCLGLFDSMDEEEIDEGLLNIKAQCFYSLHRYQEAYDLYQELIEGFEPEDYLDQPELIINLYASCFLGESSGHLFDFDEMMIESHSFDIMFNQALLRLEAGNYAAAKPILENSLEILEEANDGALKKKYESSIRGCLALCEYHEGKHLEALHKLADIRKSTDTSGELKLISGNNEVAIHSGGHNVINALRRTNIQSNIKLNPLQKDIILFNRVIILCESNEEKRIKEAYNLLEDIKNSTYQNLATALVLYSDHKMVKAEALLKENVDNQALSPYLMQLLCLKGNFEEAIEVLDNNNATLLKSAVGIATKAKLIEISTEDPTAAATFLMGNIIEENKLEMIEEAAKLFALSKEFQKAVDCYSLLDFNKLPIEAKARFIGYLLDADLDTSSYINQIDDLDVSKVDVKELERLPSHQLPHSVQVEGLKRDLVAESEKVKKPKNKKKKKNKLPKNFNPDISPDPNRWLPKLERDALKRKGKAGRHQKDQKYFAGAMQGDAEVQNVNADKSSKATKFKSKGRNKGRMNRRR